ncbi:MAG: putative metalloprotease CJM1_0395 family protein [Phycisphaerae bacterium]|nr:putative metalloprotease CJM1_0395 family protein [Phycisphaerae bacterium]
MIVRAPVTPVSAVARLGGGGCGCGGGCDCAAKSRPIATAPDRVELSDEARRAADAQAAERESEAPRGEKARPTEQAASNSAARGAAQGSGLTPEEQEQVQRLKTRDAEVRAHEQAHKAAAGSLAVGGPSYEFQRGPDGRQYAVGGEVQIDTSAVSGDAEATIRKMSQVIAAALAPAEPSGQDRAVAAAAAATRAQAQAELAEERAAESGGAGAASGASESGRAGSSEAKANSDTKRASDASSAESSAADADAAEYGAGRSNGDAEAVGGGSVVARDRRANEYAAIPLADRVGRGFDFAA